MTTRNRMDLKVKVKEVKIPQLTKENKMKLETWGLGRLFSADWSQSHENLLAILDPTSPTPDWGDVVKKTVTRQVKGLKVCNEPTCLEPYLAHLYLHFNELHNEKMEGQKKRKAHEQTVTDSNMEREEEVKAKSESQNATWIGEASRKTRRWP
ncbi:hypothetical protein R1flu_000782 [Riccia fluitans]|uniref:Uncharacterized protein n=1 Tax=Riccia fluitans TaxID=41844 RepID=A0ABD1Y1G5_9MARC